MEPLLPAQNVKHRHVGPLLPARPITHRPGALRGAERGVPPGGLAPTGFPGSSRTPCPELWLCQELVTGRAARFCVTAAAVGPFAIQLVTLHSELLKAGVVPDTTETER